MWHKTVIRNDITTKFHIVFDASTYYAAETRLIDMTSMTMTSRILFVTLLTWYTVKISFQKNNCSRWCKQAYLQIEIKMKMITTVFNFYGLIIFTKKSIYRWVLFHSCCFRLTCSLFCLNSTVRHYLTKYINLEEIKHVIERLILNLHDSTTSFEELSNAVEFYYVSKSTTY